MIKNITLKFGRAAGQEPARIEATPLTVFVGPNNSGKSRALSEIHNFCISGRRDAAAVILDQIEFEGLPADEAEQLLERISLAPRFGENLASGDVMIRGRHSVPANRATLLESFRNPTENSATFCSYYLISNTLMLGGAGRINLVHQQPSGDLQAPLHTSFQTLFRDDAKRAEVRRMIFEAFGLYLVIDPTHLAHLRLRMSKRPPKDPIEERGIHDEAVKFHAAAAHIEEFSDGVKAFTGIVCEIVAGDPEVISIDEPEAFLHPALAITLGKEIALAASKAGKRVFVSTHSPNFVMGCIQSGVPTNIVRLTYRSEVATARILHNRNLLKLMRNPLLRSTGLLSGLFYEFVIVAESDADRAFYQEVNERLMLSGGGIPNCLFLNAQNKQTVQTIIKPLRELGIPAVGIVDIDVLKDGGCTWTEFLGAGNVPELEHLSLGSIRHAIKEKLEQTGKNMKRDGGIELLAGPDREAAQNLLAKLQQYGLFVVKSGELESWLKPLGATGHGPAWLVQIFEKMGENPDSAHYVHPGSGDVWEFLRGIRSWMMDPHRCGIPV